MGQGFTAKRLADMAGVSVRTLHYYEELGLLHPMRDANGWRRYGERDIAALRVILTLRSCGLTAGEIRPLLVAEEPDMLKTLSFHRERLMAEHRRIETLLATTDMFIEGWKDMKNMTDEESFEMLKQHCIERFEEEYGAEARQRYGASAIEEANARMAAMSQQDWNTKEELEVVIKDALRALVLAGDPNGPEAAELAAMHGRWIRMHWGDAAYTPEAHVALAKGYLEDARFVAYYDEACGSGATAFLAAAIENALG